VNKKRIILLDERAFDTIVATKDEFIVYLQDEIAQLKAQLREDKPERVRVETDFKPVRGYKSVHAKIREQVLANKKLHTPIEITEDAYEKVEVDG
jgi:hypothetical protein